MVRLSNTYPGPKQIWKIGLIFFPYNMNKEDQAYFSTIKIFFFFCIVTLFMKQNFY